LSVLIVSSEAVPFSPPGPLGQFVGALPSALGSLGHRVTVVVPKYAGVPTPSAPVDRFEVPMGDATEVATVYEVPLGLNARTVLVEHAGFFGREHVYGPTGEDYPDNPMRFAFLSRAALEFAAREGERVDVVQSYDWPTGLVPVYLRTLYASAPALAGARSVFTIHNIAFQGLCDAGWLSSLGLARELFSLEGLEYWGRVSLLKGGINFADVVSAPGEDAVERLLTPGGGAGFEGILAARGEAFRSIAGAVNGHRGAEDEWAVPGIVRRLAALYGEAVSTHARAH
jgi:starch synthase